MFILERVGAGEIFYATTNSAGFDICSNEDIILTPHGRVLVDTGLIIREAMTTATLTLNNTDFEVVPELQIRPRSGLAFEYGISVLNSPGTIDADYRGNIKVLLINHGNLPVHICKGDRIAQMVCTLTVRVPNIPVRVMNRESGGFGSTN